MICEEAFLSHEGDIRNWAQQLGRQIEGDQLSFHAFFSLGEKPKIIKKHIEDYSFFTRQYLVYMFLDRIPECVIENKHAFLSTDNYDDKPTSTRDPIPIVEIDHKNLRVYEQVRNFIQSIKPKK